eukprot:sb/3463952/
MIRDIVSPLIDQLAGEGFILDRFYAMHICTPTRAALQTGVYPISLGIQANVFLTHTKQCLQSERILIAEAIRANGYATHLVGKWHLGYSSWDCLPCARGYDTAYGYTQGETDYFDHTIVKYQDFYYCSAGNDTHNVSISTLPGTTGIYSMKLYQERINQILNDHDPEQPLFLFYSMQTVHAPFETTEYDLSPNCTDMTDPLCVMQGMINSAEDSLNRTITKFQEKGMWENTIMVYMSDNGSPSNNYGSNRPLRGYKATLFEGGVRTPAFLYSANETLVVPRGRTSCKVHVTDWYRTLIETTGGWDAYLEEHPNSTVPEELDSIDQSKLLLTGETEECLRDELLVHLDPVGQRAAYIKGDLKVLFGEEGLFLDDCVQGVSYNLSAIDYSNTQLYNLTMDPGERRNLADMFPDAVEELKERIQSYIKDEARLQCNAATFSGSFPIPTVPYYLPFDFPGGAKVTSSLATLKVKTAEAKTNAAKLYELYSTIQPDYLEETGPTLYKNCLSAPPG